jgi:FtsP/CotA-like multicopper oxidase with cupredoxin domain
MSGEVPQHPEITTLGGGLRRRQFLAGLAGIGAVAVAAGPFLLQAGEAGAQAVQPGPLDAQDLAPWLLTQPGGALPIPPVLSPPVRDGIRTFNLNIQAGQVAFEPERPAQTLGINGPYLGPVLRASQGDTVAFNILNSMTDSTTLHWHGMHLPPTMDGGPRQPIAPGAMWLPQWTIRQQSATLWYHSHLMGQTRAQVRRGLASMFILDDDNPAQIALPHTYGVDDIPLIFQEYVFGGGQTLVNGALSPVLATEQSRLRLRLLNASDQQIYTFGFAGNLAFDQVASDGGLLNAPVRLTRLTLGPAERADIVVDLSGEPVALQRLGGGGGGGRGNGGGNGAGGTLLTIQPSSNASAADLPPLPTTLNSIVRMDPATVSVTRQMVLGGVGRGGRTINGVSMQTMADMMDMSNVARVRLGDVERWNIVNQGGGTHLFHVHDVQFQILNRNGAAPAPNELGRKDTVQVRPGETVPLLMRFTDFADADTPYMYHCHILQHEDQGMMGQFVVVPA